MKTLQTTEMPNYSTLLSVFDRYHSFALSTHINPDGDAIGSQLALYTFLTEIGKSVKVFNTDAVPKNYKFLPGGISLKRLMPLIHIDQKYSLY